jgi:hypothetical protein
MGEWSYNSTVIELDIRKVIGQLHATAVLLPKIDLTPVPIG